MDADNIPPGRVTDLQAKNLPDMIAVQFTAPGDDLDSNDKAASYVVKYSSTVGNLTGDNFDKDEFNTEITNDDLVNSTLDPEAGGTTKTFFIKDSIFTVGEKYILALRAVDEKGNKGAVSNPVQIYLPPASTQSSSSHFFIFSDGQPLLFYCCLISLTTFYLERVMWQQNVGG